MRTEARVCVYMYVCVCVRAVEFALMLHCVEACAGLRCAVSLGDGEID